MFYEFLQRKAEEEKDFVVDFESILKELESSLPVIPPKIQVEQVNPPPYAMGRLLFGKLMPKPEDEDGDKKKKQKKQKAP